MKLKEIARMIPAEYRHMILAQNAIYKAVAVPLDPHMQMLFTVWTNFINPGGGLSLECTRCLGQMLDDYKKLQPEFINLEREAQLLDDL
jgi:hypothetical protein